MAVEERLLWGPGEGAVDLEGRDGLVSALFLRDLVPWGFLAAAAADLRDGLLGEDSRDASGVDLAEFEPEMRPEA